MLKFKSWHVFLFRRGWSSKAGVWNSRHLEANYWKGLMSHRGMQPRLVNPPILTTRQLYLVFCDMFSGGCAWGCVMCPFFAYKHLSCKTIQISEWLHIRKAALVILHCYMHGRSACHDWMEFWFHYIGQSGHLWMWVYTLCHPQRSVCQLENVTWT